MLNHSGSIIANGQTEVVAQQGLSNAGQIDVHRLNVKGAVFDNQNGNITTRQHLSVDNEQIAQLTGHRRLNAYQNDEEQFKALMDNGATAAKNMNLTVGIALSAEQVARLTSDIVWLVQKEVKLPDGSTQTVLAPQVYVRVKDGNINGKGALLSGSHTQLNISDGLTNTGTIAGRKALIINTNTLDNIGGHIHAQNAAVATTQDINNIGGTLSAEQTLLLTAANNINIEAAYNQSYNTTTQTQEQKGLSVSVRSALTDAAQQTITTAQSIQRIGKSKNSRVNAMAAANAVWDTLDSADALSPVLNHPKAATLNNLSVSVSYGKQKNRQTNQTQATEAQASQIQAGGSTTLIATDNGKAANINITGSDVAGKTATTLIADKHINLQSAQQRSNERSHDHSSGWNLGVNAGYANGNLAVGISAGGNKGKGKAKGDSLTQRNTHIGGQTSQTTLHSGGNTALKGAQVLGNSIQIDAQNLTIESRQDTETYRNNQNKLSAQINLGYGASGSADYSQSRINADYASVAEQSGVLAGDEGYRISSAGNTDLKGGIITSTQKAEDSGKNRFSTGTLTASDIRNHSHYDGKSIGLGVSGSISGEILGQKAEQTSHLSTVANQNGFNKTLGYGSDNGSQSSVTQSGIHTRNIHIGSDTAGEQVKAVYTDTTTETAQQNLSRLKNTFDKEEVQKELDVQRTVSQSFSKNVQTANAQINQHLDSLKAQLDKGEISQTEYDSKVASWQKGQVLLNSIATGLSAPTQSATGIAAATASPALSYQIGQTFKKHDAEGTPAHILAHAVLGAAVAAAGDNNALAGALSAGGAEAAAPMISQYLYGEKDGSKLSAEQKETVTAITGLLGTATGAMVGDSTANAAQGNLNAQSAVENNSRVRRSSARNPSWTEAQVRQNKLNVDRINALINQIKRIEPNFKGLSSVRDPNRPITNEEVQAYEQYLNRITPQHSIADSSQSVFKVNSLPRIDRSNSNTLVNDIARDISLNQLGQAFNARPRVNGNLDARNINLQVGFKTVRPNPSASQNGMPVYSHMSEKEIFSVYQQYTGSQPSFRNIPNKGMLASTTIQSGSWKGATVVLRNFSTSRNQTGARWTIEFQNLPSSVGRQRIELKFQ